MTLVPFETAELGERSPTRCTSTKKKRKERKFCSQVDFFPTPRGFGTNLLSFFLICPRSLFFFFLNIFNQCITEAFCLLTKPGLPASTYF